MREASKSKDTFIASEFDLSGGKPTLVKVHSKELHDLAAKYSSLIAESFFLQNVRGTYSDFDSYLRKAHSALLAFLKSKTLDPEDPNLLLRALYNGRVPQNSPFKPTPVVRDKKENTKGPPPPAAAAAASHTSQQLQQHPQLPKPPEIIHPKKYAEKLKAEASVVQRISELQKEGMWYDRRLPRNHEPSRIKAHWDYLLEEMTWLATDFASERKWKRNASKRCAKMIDKYFNDREIERLRAEKEEEIRLRRIASFIAKEIKNFWSNAQQIVEYKEQSRIEEMKKKALDQQLSYIVDQTEKYSSMLAESFVGDSSLVGIAADTHDTAGGETTCCPHSLETPSDDEFEPAQESEDDDEETIAKEEEENEEGENELYDLERNGQMSLDDLLDGLPPGYLEELTSKIDKVSEAEPPASETDKPPPSPASSDKNDNANSLIPEEKPPLEIPPTPKNIEVGNDDVVKISDETAIAKAASEELEQLDVSVEGVPADSASELDSEIEDSESETAEEDPSSETDDSDILTEAEEDEPEDEEQTVGLASLLQAFAPERAGEVYEEDDALNSVAAMAESFQPKGYTLSSQTVNTKVPSLLHHTLREYQLIGLDWLVTMHEKKLNGILADEMGLGKTIQTIALLAHLACEKGNWGPHLIVVPTSVMLNWEMEFKKWCPGFKILTYYGSIKERRLKRTGWTKPNAFHVCITSYKLVIQDHGSFRRKRWKYLILDEAQNIKNFKSQRWQLLLNFSTHRRLLLTGTPLQNNLMELWSLMHFLMPNVFQSHREFREWFSNPVSGMVEGNSEYNENIIRRLHKVLRPFILRRLKCEVEKQLPKKHEHVVMCRLSKRQRFLYEDFMSRSKTKETLATGNLLSVINVLMQLRKVCNHPNLFESRPVISPLLSVGITYLIPSIVWNLYENLVKDATHPLYGMSKSDLLYTKSQSERILHLKPPGEENYSPNTLSPDSYLNSSGSLKRKLQEEEEDITEYDYILQTTVVSTLPDGSIKCAPKRRKFLKWCADVALPAPRTKAPIPFFLMNVDPTPYLDDVNFIEAVGESAPKPFYLKVVSQPSETDRQQIPNNDNHLLPAEVGFQNSAIPEVPSPTVSSPETQRCKPKSYQEDDDPYESDSLDEEQDEREDNESEEDSFEDDSDDISDSYSDDIDDDEPSRKRRKRTLAPKGDRKRLRRMSAVKKNEDDEKCKDSYSMEEMADSTEIDDTASEDYNLDKRNKVNCGMKKSSSGAQWAKAMGYNPSEFQETDVQARSIRNRRALIDRLKFVNDQRCEVLPVFGFDALDQCRILGSLPVMRYYGTRCRHLKIPYRGRSVKRDYIKNAYFLQGYEEVYSISQVKNSQSTHVRNHPLLIWRHTKALMSAVWSLEEVLEEFSPILKRFIIYVPAVSSPLLTSRIFRPSPSLYAQQFNFEEELREVLREPSAILHPIISSMSTQFPDPRLIQYDCGKLQVLDTLLRRLKSETHRVLIFTQMAKMLDVLEAFLNYHGHIYLRLDGATRIDQRQILMEKFNSDKRIFCFILSTRSGGIGINLTGADTVIFYDSDWNPTMDAQAQDRCHRIGQTRDVHIYRLVSEKTIEENILKKSNQKRLLGELAIEGGNFTTAFFQKHSIYELFDVQTNENDAMKRLTERSEESVKPLEIRDVEIEDTKDVVVPAVVDKNQMQIFESALAAAEDETDVQATRTVKAEAAAELAEFDESIPLEDLGDGQDIVEKSMIDTEMESIMAELSKVEIYALKFMESTIDDWSRETVAQAQKELEQQKREWEMEQIRQLEARNKMGTDCSDEEDMLTYSVTDAQNQVWISQGGGEHFMPLWAPPTPPSDDSDVYVDYCHGLLYDYDFIPESNLPPVYQPPKKDKKPVVVPVPNVKQSALPVPVPPNLPDEEVVAPLNSTVEKKSPKVPRRDEPIFAPRSLFDRPSPAMAKLRRDYRLQKYNCRPVVTAALNKSSLGPGAITFPIVHPTSTKAPSPPPQHESVEWMIAEDHALLQTIQTILEMPLSLLVVNLAQTPNWDLAAEMVNLTSKIHRSPKQCKIRYETIVGPREEGKLFYEQPPAVKNKKKSKSFIKVGPPSPSRTGRIVKMSQLITADNNSQLLNTYMAKFDLVKNVAIKRPLTKPMTLNPHMKTNKQAATIFAEHGINLENPISATAIALARYERLQLERKKLYAAQQAAVAAAGTTQSPHPVTTAALNAAAALAVEGNRINAAATTVTIPVTTVGAASVVGGPIVSNAVIVPSSVGITASPGTATVVTATASEVHKAKIAAQAAQASDLPVIRFTHPASATTLQEMIQRRSPGATSNNPIIAKRQHALTQQQNQLQQQLQILQQHQMTQKHPKISLQLAQVAQKPNQSTTTLQQSGAGVQQIQVSNAQQVVISQPSSILAKAQQGNNLTPAVHLQGQRQVMMQGTGQVVSQQAQSSVLSQSSIQLQQKQVVMAYQQAVSQASQQQKQQQIQIQLPQSPTVQTGTIQQATLPAQSIHVSNPQSVVINQPTSIATSITPNSPITSTIQLQGQKQIVMTGSGQAQILTQQQQQQISQSTIQLQGQKQVVMAYQTGSQGQIIQKQSPQITQQLQQSQQQQQQQTQVHVHLHTPSSQGQGVALGHPTQTVVLPQGLAHALVSSAANLTPTLNLMTTTSPVLSTMTSTGVATSGSGVVTPTSVSIPRAQQVGSHTGQQGQRTVTMQLVKQHTVGGKTVTRTVSDSEIAAFLKQHGLTPSTRVAIAGQPGTQAQIGQLTGAKGQQVAQVQVPAAQIITSMGLQKLGYQISPSGGGAQVATVLKTPASQASSAQGTSLAFPLSFSQVRSVSQKAGTHTLNKQPTQINFQQQILSQQRRQTQQQQQQQTASKLAHIAQVSSTQGSVPQLIVQATPKQIQNTINVQHIQHVLKPSQVIQGQSGVLQAQLLAHKTMSRMVTSSASSAAVSSGTVSGVTPTMVTVSSNSGSGLPTAVTIPTSLVSAPSGQGGIIRISQQSQSIKPGSIQMITAQTASLLNQQQSLARPYAQGQNISTVNVTSGTVGSQSMPIRLQGSTGNVLPGPQTLTNVSIAGAVGSETGTLVTSVAEVASPTTKIILTEEAGKPSSSETSNNPSDNAV